ncbi:hypothetical protein ACL6C3_12145 [Capilliphycus salinus ALCB114379]|uniref:hypothetical protein n=1 Tax=Capilliphycus salinus TaxID=2768948 RepID=UPI0039A49A33
MLLISESQGECSIESGQNFPKLNLSSALNCDYGIHRSGWSYVINSLKPLHHPSGIFVDGFIERKFCWGDNPGEAQNNPTPYQEPWVGFIHVPPRVPKWFHYEQAPQSIFKTQLWQESLPYCQGLFCLSEYHKLWLEKRLDVPIISLFHPTEIPSNKFDFENFLANSDKKIVQIGWWLRKLNSIYCLPTQKLRKAILMKNEPHYRYLLEKEREIFNLQVDEDAVELMPFLSNEDYDKLLTENIIYLDLYDASANNVIIECMARHTPLLVNPIPAVREYLGEDYPLYFSSREEAREKGENWGLIREANEYLKQDWIRERLMVDSFNNNLISQLLQGKYGSER